MGACLRSNSYWRAYVNACTLCGRTCCQRRLLGCLPGLRHDCQCIPGVSAIAKFPVGRVWWPPLCSERFSQKPRTSTYLLASLSKAPLIWLTARRPLTFQVAFIDQDTDFGQLGGEAPAGDAFRVENSGCKVGHTSMLDGSCSRGLSYSDDEADVERVKR